MAQNSMSPREALCNASNNAAGVAAVQDHPETSNVWGRIASGIERLGFSDEVKVNAISRDAKFLWLTAPDNAWFQLAEPLAAALDDMNYDEANSADSDGVPDFWQLTNLDSFDFEHQAFASGLAGAGYVFDWLDGNDNVVHPWRPEC